MQAVAAMELAEAAGEIPPDDDLWCHDTRFWDARWPAELGLSGPDAVARGVFEWPVTGDKSVTWRPSCSTEPPTSGGPRMVADTPVHEMTHAALILRGEDPEHNGEPWRRLSRSCPRRSSAARSPPARRPRRVPNPDRAE